VSERRHLIGLLLGTEEDWPQAFEAIVRRLGPVTDGAGEQHHHDVERITIEPFDLRSVPRHQLVIDRLAYWYYLLNGPFTFQTMAKQAAYCAMIRLGPRVPGTVLIPYKRPPGPSFRRAPGAEQAAEPRPARRWCGGTSTSLTRKPRSRTCW
jgi:hypothetical protein